jgi:hypothetical protein
MNRKASTGTALIWIAGGWLANALWELAHSPLYEGFADAPDHLGMCLRAAVVDVGILALLYAAMSLAARRLDWWRRFSLSRATLLAGAGFAIATAIELRALAEGRWAYSAGMPLVPGLGVGWSPVLQMMVIPVSLVLLSRWWSERFGNGDATEKG